jgi:hypothetical protein
MEGAFVKIVDLDNVSEANLVDAILEEKGIPHLVHPNYDSAYDGIYKLSYGWGYIEAPEEHRAAILEVRDDIRKSREPGP